MQMTTQQQHETLATFDVKTLCQYLMKLDSIEETFGFVANPNVGAQYWQTTLELALRHEYEALPDIVFDPINDKCYLKFRGWVNGHFEKRFPLKEKGSELPILDFLSGEKLEFAARCILGNVAKLDKLLELGKDSDYQKQQRHRYLVSLVKMMPHLNFSLQETVFESISIVTKTETKSFVYEPILLAVPDMPNYWRIKTLARAREAVEQPSIHLREYLLCLDRVRRNQGPNGNNILDPDIQYLQSRMERLTEGRLMSTREGAEFAALLVDRSLARSFLNQIMVTYGSKYDSISPELAEPILKEFADDQELCSKVHQDLARFNRSELDSFEYFQQKEAERAALLAQMSIKSS